MLSSRDDGIDRETSKEVEWKVSLPQTRRWRLQSPEFSFEGLNYKLWVYTDFVHPNRIRAQLDMQGPFIANPSRVVQWQVGLKCAGGDGPQWTERHEIPAEKVYSGWNFVDKWKIFELSELQQKKEVLVPNGQITLILQLRMIKAQPSSQSFIDIETIDLQDYEKAVQVNNMKLTPDTDRHLSDSSEHLTDKRGIQHADISNSDDLTQPEKRLPCLLNSLSRTTDRTEHQIDDLNNSTQSLQPKKSTPAHKKTKNYMPSTKNTDTASLDDSSKLHRHKRKRINAELMQISSSDEENLTLLDRTLCLPNSLSKVIDLTEHQVDDLNGSPQSVPNQKSTLVQEEIENCIPSMKNSDTASFKEFQEIVFQKLDTILHKIKVFENKLETIENNLKTNRETEDWKKENFGMKCEKDYFKLFPLTTDSAVLEVEEELHTKGIDDLVTSLRAIGGSNEQECITRILQRVLTNEIAEQYSWSGFKGNKVFKQLNLSKAIFYAAKSHYPSLTEKSAEQIIAKWLKYAKQRKQRSEEKSKKLKDD